MAVSILTNKKIIVSGNQLFLPHLGVWWLLLTGSIEMRGSHIQLTIDTDVAELIAFIPSHPIDYAHANHDRSQFGS